MDRHKDEDMTHNVATKFRWVAVGLNYSALDRPDLGVAAGRLSRSMARPSVSEVQALKGHSDVSKGNQFLGLLSIGSLSRESRSS